VCVCVCAERGCLHASLKGRRQRCQHVRGCCPVCPHGLSDVPLPALGHSTQVLELITQNELKLLWAHLRFERPTINEGGGGGNGPRDSLGRVITT